MKQLLKFRYLLIIIVFILGCLGSIMVDSYGQAFAAVDNPHGDYDRDTSKCAACHSGHSALAGSLLRNITQKETCYDCHDGSNSVFDIKLQFGEKVGSMVYSYHPVPSGSQLCTACHNPHLAPVSSPGGTAKLLEAGETPKVSSGNNYCGVCHGADTELGGGDMVTPLESYGPIGHNSAKMDPQSGTQVKCASCHQPHGSPFDYLLREKIEDESGVTRSVYGNNNTFCYGCHTDGVRNWKGQDVYTQSKHGSTLTSSAALTTYPGVDYAPTGCMNCHEPHGKTGITDYKRAVDNALCSKCHDDSSVQRPSLYSYRGIASYNDTPHASATTPTAIGNMYKSTSQGFMVWEAEGTQTPANPGTAMGDLTPLLTWTDGSWLVSDLTTSDGVYNTQMFRFKISEGVETINEIKPKWIGYGEPTTNYFTEFSIWNRSLNGGAGGWEKLLSQQQSADISVEANRTNVSDYINSAGEVYFLAGAAHDATLPQILNLRENLINSTSVRIAWETNEPAKSWIDFGTTPFYGLKQENPLYNTSHSFDMLGLTKGVTYHYRVTSVDKLGNKTESEDRIFQLADPPPAPTLIPPNDIDTYETSELVTLSWYTVNAPDNDPVEYQVEVAGYALSPWMDELPGNPATQNWTVELPTQYSSFDYSWRVKVRDKNHPVMEAASDWDYFKIKTSCPILYTWDGEKYTFISDVMGLGTLGLPIGQGQYRYPPSVEATKVSRYQLKAESGRYKMILKNELDEIEFVDRLVLKAVDHPVGTELFVNDFTRGNRPVDPMKLYTTRNLRPVKSASYINNPLYTNKYAEQDITELVSKIDSRYAPASLFDDNQYILDLGDLSGADEIKVVVGGWSKFASQQERQKWLKSGAPKAQRAMDVMGNDGQWVQVIDDLPYIPGLTKTAVYDLTGKFPEGVKEYKVRLRGLPRTYFDYIAVDTSVTEEVKVHDLAPVKAELRYQGRSFYMERPEPVFDYYKQGPGERLYHEGNFTRYGDVRPLLETTDDMFVIMDTGDAIELEFNEVPVAPGMVRDYIFYADGYFQEITGKVEPMPFHAMSNYPYPPSEKYPDDPEHREYIKQWNTRVHPPTGPEAKTASLADRGMQKINVLLQKVANNWTAITRIAAAVFHNETRLALGNSPNDVNNVMERLGLRHYSINTNYIELEVISSVLPGAAGSCTNCHAVHGNSGATKQLKVAGAGGCLAEGCHNDAANSVSGINIKERFTAAAGYTSRHSVDPVEQSAYGTKVECINCHDPHLNNAENRTVNPDSRYQFLNQWVDNGISNYISVEGAVYVMAKAKHDGNPPVVSNVVYSADADQLTATIAWQTDETSTRQVEWGTTTDYVYSVGNSVDLYGQSTYPVLHSLKLTGLEPGQEYHYRIKAVDALGNTSYSGDRVFIMPLSGQTVGMTVQPAGTRVKPNNGWNGIFNWLAAVFTDKDEEEGPSRPRIAAKEPVKQPGHFSLNTNYLAVGIGTKEVREFYLPNYAGSRVWEKAAMPTFENPGSEILSGTDKDMAAVLDGQALSTDAASADGQYNYQLYSFGISQPRESVNIFTVRWTGYGEPTVGYDTAVYLWNFSQGSWEQIGTKSGGGYFTGEDTFSFSKNKDNSAFCNKCHDNTPPVDVFMGYSKPTNLLGAILNDFHGDYRGTGGRIMEPYTIGISRVACDDCHDPHGSTNAYHLRETVNGRVNSSVISADGRGAQAFCQGCHVGDLYNDWHQECMSCHPDVVDAPVHYVTIPELPGLIDNCFRCHGHNKQWFNQTSCNNCHGSGTDHNWSRTF